MAGAIAALAGLTGGGRRQGGGMFSKGVVGRQGAVGGAADEMVGEIVVDDFRESFHMSAGYWDAEEFEERLWWDDEEHWVRMAAELLSPYVRRGERIAVMWGNYLMPAVTMPADVAVRRARDILDAGPHFWIHPLGGSVLIECLMDGQVTVATIPSG
ncbi:hypothetical protein M8C13_20055 [Crossiella sp. SN42]|uniref:hypothetical protein n=1 Tax=Crossiella sp. SN42 TaxID=2944808 RepID=UPI00207C2BAA|nr:hypothetical protein [Crossiella sp. SN42]MCO1578050.1 hypothetical protein [Crossiella sp. SN42]